MRARSDRAIGWALALVLAGCGGSAEGEAPRATSGGEATAAAISENQQGRLVAAATAPTATAGAGPTVAGAPQTGPLGADREHPVPRCGAMESYLYVAQEFQCPGGGNPLGGDPRAGAQARIGNVGPHAHGPERDPMLDAHIVDLYEIPCPSGPVQVHVCLYHCPPGRTPLGP